MLCSNDDDQRQIIKRKKFWSEKAKRAHRAWTQIGKAAALSELPFVLLEEGRYEGAEHMGLELEICRIFKNTGHVMSNEPQDLRI